MDEIFKRRTTSSTIPEAATVPEANMSTDGMELDESTEKNREHPAATKEPKKERKERKGSKNHDTPKKKRKNLEE